MMATVPLEIIVYDILPRLPAKSLKRFKCVSKPWLALISSHDFIHLHLHHALSSNTNHLLILTGNDSSLYSCNLDLPESGAVKLPSFGIEPFVVGSCNGLLCVQSYRPYCLVLLNPSTGSYRKIPSLLPPRRCSSLNFGFGYDSKNDDYKVVRIVDRSPSSVLFGHQLDRIVHVYSLKKNSWELIEWTSPQGFMGYHENGVFVNNRFLLWKFWYIQEGIYQIRCFDLCENQWTHDVPLPDYMVVGSNTNHSDHDHVLRNELLDFGVFDGSLYLCIKDQKESAVDMWVMNEYGVKESWVKLFKISDSRVFGSIRVTPIAYQCVKHQILLRTVNKTEHKIVWYNIVGETADCAEISGVADCLWVDVCKGSLLDVPGGAQVGTAKQNDEEVWKLDL